MNPSMHRTELNSGVFMIDHFLSADECAHYIAHGDALGFGSSEVNFPSGSRLALEIRNNERVLFDDKALAAQLFARAKPLLPQQVAGWELLDFNERMRFYRYGPQQYFKWHKDGSYARQPGDASLLTFMIYLNDGFEGGATEFRTEFVQPKAGRALVFPHRAAHQGTEILSGTKYVLRTDVMYVRIGTD